jgi:hypothetical protein
MQSIEALKRRRLEQRFHPFAEGPVSADRDKAMWDWNESTWSGYDIIDQSAQGDASTVRLTPAGDEPVVVNLGFMVSRKDRFCVGSPLL